MRELCFSNLLLSICLHQVTATPQDVKDAESALPSEGRTITAGYVNTATQKALELNELSPSSYQTRDFNG